MARLLLLLILACSPRAATPARDAGTPAPDASRLEPGVTPVDGAPDGADTGACPEGQQRCCDGQCGTPSGCAALSCDPTPPAPETR